jgi:hypothetical protein
MVTMSGQDKAALELALLEEGKKAVEDAQTALETLLSEIRVAPRAEKTAITSGIESALERLRLAREKVSDAEQIAREVKKT